MTRVTESMGFVNLTPTTQGGSHGFMLGYNNPGPTPGSISY